MKVSDLECKYTSVGGYIESLFERNLIDNENVDSLIEAYSRCTDEMKECSKRDWSILKQAQSEICRLIVEAYIKSNKKGPVINT